MAALPKVLTYEEWLQLPPVEDGRDEVVNGELRFMPPNHYPHAEIVDELSFRFNTLVDRKKVKLLASTFGLMISREPLTCRSPDLALYWRKDVVIEDGLHYSAPDLIVEIISPSETRRRKEEKITDYEKIGVPEVWLISPQGQTVEVRVLRDGKLHRTGIFVDGTIEPTKFPGVKIDVTSIWPE